MLQYTTKVNPETLNPNVGALVIRMGFWGFLIVIKDKLYHNIPKTLF